MATFAVPPFTPSDVGGDTLSSMTALLCLDVENLPSTIVWDQPVSDEMLERLCAANDLLQLERTKEGVIRVNPPTAMFTSDGNSEVIYQLRMWWNERKIGRAFDSNAGFYLEDGSMLSPDGAYLSPQRLATLKSRSDRAFPHVCPDFVIELLSESDSLKATKRKMEAWIANGVLLGWLIDPYKRKVLVYVPDAPPLTISATMVRGHGPVEGFTLDLERVWRCYE